MLVIRQYFPVLKLNKKLTPNNFKIAFVIKKLFLLMTLSCTIFICSQKLSDKLTEDSHSRAEQIIRKTIKAFKSNSPLQLDEYSYKSYDKFSLDMHPDSISQYQFLLKQESAVTIRPSKKFSFKKHLENHKLIIWERMQQISYSKKSGKKIQILDNKLSGTNVPIMDMFVIQNNRNKLPEILNEKEKKLHRFYLTDTVDIDHRSTYIIKYEYIDENKKSSQNYYNGLFFIDADTFGIKRFVYNSDSTGESYYVANYKYINEKWFLEEEDLRLKTYRVKLNHKKNRFGIYAFMKSKYYDFENTALPPAKGYTYSLENTSGNLLKSHRFFSLNNREKQTYKALDSLRLKYNLDRKTHFVNGLISGVIRIGKLDFDPLEIINFNDYEGLRLGSMVKTNSLFNPRISPDVQFSYGLRDRKMNFRLGIDYKRRLDRNAVFRLSYYNSIMTSGDFSRKFWNFKMRTSNFGNNFNNDKFYLQKGFGFSYQEDVTNSLSLQLEIKSNIEKALFDYEFMNSGKAFYNNSTIFSLKYSPNTTNVMTYDGKSIVDQGYPELYFNWEQGYRNLGGKLSYGRFDVLFIHQLQSLLGTSRIKIFGGLVTGKTPIWHLFTVNGLASSERRLNFNVTSFLGFSTLTGGEFFTDKFAGIYFAQELPWYFRVLGKNMSSIDIVYRGHIGNLSNKNSHNYPVKTLDHLYQEVGLECNNFLSTPFDLGLFYRVGYYNTPLFLNNFGLQIKLNFLKF